MMKTVIVLLAMLPAVTFGWNWRNSWRIPADIYRNLDFTVRAGVDRSTKIFNDAIHFENGGGRITDAIPRYRAAAAEWRKVQVQAEAENFDETVISYSVFMQAYSKELARDRNDAVKLYTEIIDLYPDVKWVSIPARYRLGCTQIAMGDVKRGNETINALVEDSDAAGNPVIADAILIIARRLWSQGQLSKAQERWMSLLETPYYKSSRDQWNRARKLLLMTSFIVGDYAKFEEVVFAEMPEENDKDLFERVKGAYNLYYNCFLASSQDEWECRNLAVEGIKKETERTAKLAAAKKGFYKWFSGKRAVYEKAKATSDFLVALFRIGTTTSSSLSSEVDKIRKVIKSEKIPEKQQAFAFGVIDSLCRVKSYDFARTIPDSVNSPLHSAWMRYSIERSAGKWKEAVIHLDEYLLRKPSPAQERSAKYLIAEICRDRLSDRERAVKLYLDINDPPRSLWELQRTYRAMGEKKKSYQVLNEISSIFPREAPQAVLTCARYREDDGEKKKAIALYRQLLTHPEWKKSPASSQAHQALEKYGIATGGAMINEVR